MKVIEIHHAFGLDHLTLSERPQGEPGPGQVRVKMKAASLNYRDLLVVLGHYDPKQSLPLIPCSDGAGVVEAVGEGVSRFEAGQRVTTLFAQKWWSEVPDFERMRSTLGGPLDGTLTESMVLSEEGLVAAPEHLSDVEAATLPCAAVTAWSALVTLGNVRPGDTVLVQGTGGVSIFALQFANVLGARTIVTSSSDEKLERARELGAWETINYKEVPEWGKQARRLSDGGVDHVVEVGGGGTLEQSLVAVRAGGVVSIIGVLSGPGSRISVVPVMMHRLRLQGVFVGSRDGFEAMNRALAQHQIRPVVDRVFPFDETLQAFEHMQAGRHFGKIAIEI